MMGVSSCEGVFGIVVEGWEGDWAAVCMCVVCVCVCLGVIRKKQNKIKIRVW